MVDALKRINTKKALYICLAIIALFWVIFGVGRFWSTTTKRTASQNSARLVTIANKATTLPTPVTITPSKTSGSTPIVIAKYTAMQKEIQANTPKTNVLGVGPINAPALNKIDKQSKSTLQNYSSSLDQTIKALTVMQKFIEYDAKTDLQGYANGTEKDASERLSRTSTGIDKAINDVNASNLPYRLKLLDVLLPLQNKALNVQPLGVDAWSKQILTAQLAALAIIQDDYQSYTNSAVQNMTTLSQQYLSLR